MRVRSNRLPTEIARSRAYNERCSLRRSLHLRFPSVEIVSLLELIDAAAGVNQFLLAGEIRMALGADFDLDGVRLLRGARQERISARALNGGGVIVRMDAFFHCSLLSLLIFTPTRANVSPRRPSDPRSRSYAHMT